MSYGYVLNHMNHNPMVDVLFKCELPLLLHFLSVESKSYANKFDVLSFDNFGLKHACYRGNAEMVTYLISKGADVNAEQAQAVTFAATRGDMEILKILFTKKADLKNNSGPLYMACCKGKLEAVKYLISQGAPITGAALVIAANHGHLEVVKYLVSQGAHCLSRILRIKGSTRRESFRNC